MSLLFYSTQAGNPLVATLTINTVSGYASSNNLSSNSTINSLQTQYNILTNAYDSCGNNSYTNINSLSGIQFEPSTYCNPMPTMVVGNTPTVDATCLLHALQTNAANTAVSLSPQVQASLGLAQSTNQQDMQNSISQYTTNQCANVSSSNMANINDTVIESCNFEVVNDANANQSCQINSTQNLINNIATASAGQSNINTTYNMTWQDVLNMVYLSTGNNSIQIQSIVSQWNSQYNVLFYLTAQTLGKPINYSLTQNNQKIVLPSGGVLPTSPVTITFIQNQKTPTPTPVAPTVAPTPTTTTESFSSSSTTKTIIIIVVIVVVILLIWFILHMYKKHKSKNVVVIKQ